MLILKKQKKVLRNQIKMITKIRYIKKHKVRTDAKCK